MVATTDSGQSEIQFDFTPGSDPDGTQTGTIKELLEEINQQNGNLISGAVLDEKSLRGPIELVCRITGGQIKGTVQQLPLTTLKTIKLLYEKNDEYGIQLFRHLAMPGESEKPTMEHRNSRNTQRNVTFPKIANEIMEALAREIPAERLAQIETSLLSPPKLLECIFYENEEILAPLFRTFKGSSTSFTESYRFLTEETRNFPQRKYALVIPAHEALYTYINTLPFFHFVGEYKKIIELARISPPVPSMQDEIKQFCKELSEQTGESIGYNTPITSVEEFPEFIQKHDVQLRALVESATGISSRKDDFVDTANLTSKVVNAYVFHQEHKIPLHVTTLSAADCVAALCTVRHQQKEKTNYSPAWIGRSNKEIQTSPLKQMDRKRGIEELYSDDYIPHGAMQFMYYRFCEFHAGFIDDMERHNAWMGFQVARLERYAKCFLSNDIDQINRSIMDLNTFCSLQAIQASRRFGDDTDN